MKAAIKKELNALDQFLTNKIYLGRARGILLFIIATVLAILVFLYAFALGLLLAARLLLSGRTLFLLLLLPFLLPPLLVGLRGSCRRLCALLCILFLALLLGTLAFDGSTTLFLFLFLSLCGLASLSRLSLRCSFRRSLGRRFFSRSIGGRGWGWGWGWRRRGGATSELRRK